MSIKQLITNSRYLIAYYAPLQHCNQLKCACRV